MFKNLRERHFIAINLLIFVIIYLDPNFNRAIGRVGTQYRDWFNYILAVASLVGAVYLTIYRAKPVNIAFASAPIIVYWFISVVLWYRDSTTGAGLTLLASIILVNTAAFIYLRLSAMEKRSHLDDTIHTRPD